MQINEVKQILATCKQEAGGLPNSGTLVKAVNDIRALYESSGYADVGMEVNKLTIAISKHPNKFEVQRSPYRAETIPTVIPYEEIFNQERKDCIEKEIRSYSNYLDAIHIIKTFSERLLENINEYDPHANRKQREISEKAAITLKRLELQYPDYEKERQCTKSPF